MKNVFDFLSGGDALRILRNLYAVDSNIRQRILSEAENVLRQVDVDEIAEDVYSALEALDVDELYQRTGRSRFGYSTPDETADEMVEEILAPYLERSAQYEEMSMPEQAKQYCMGVLKGIYDLNKESPSEFFNWAPDVLSEYFQVILGKWQRRHYCKQDIEDMNRFIKAECPKWVR